MINNWNLEKFDWDNEITGYYLYGVPDPIWPPIDDLLKQD